MIQDLVCLVKSSLTSGISTLCTSNNVNPQFVYFNCVVFAEMSVRNRRKSDSEVLGMKKFFSSAKATSSNSGGTSENSKKALLLRQNRMRHREHVYKQSDIV